jgi:pilus assembly protein CpaF
LGRDALHAQTFSALDVVVHIARNGSGQRRVEGLHVIQRDDSSGLVTAVPAVRFDDRGRTMIGPGSRRLEELLAR